jgi:hypothetical protein
MKLRKILNFSFATRIVITLHLLNHTVQHFTGNKVD